MSILRIPKSTEGTPTSLSNDDMFEVETANLDSVVDGADDDLNREMKPRQLSKS